MLAHDEHNPQSDSLEPESWKRAKNLNLLEMPIGSK